jgi:hypothetical protein
MVQAIYSEIWAWGERVYIYESLLVDFSAYYGHRGGTDLIQIIYLTTGSIPVASLRLYLEIYEPKAPRSRASSPETAHGPYYVGRRPRSILQ